MIFCLPPLNFTLNTADILHSVGRSHQQKSKPVRLSFNFGTQIKIFVMKFGGFCPLTVYATITFIEILVVDSWKLKSMA